MKTVLTAALISMTAGLATAGEDFRDEGVWDRHLSDNTGTPTLANTDYDVAAYDEGVFDVGQYDHRAPSGIDNEIGDALVYQDGSFDIPG